MERRMLLALKMAAFLTKNGLLRLDYVKKAYNRANHVSMFIESNRLLGSIIRGLGFNIRNSTGNKAYIIWDQDTFEFLCKREGVKK